MFANGIKNELTTWFICVIIADYRYFNSDILTAVKGSDSPIYINIVSYV